MIGRLHLRRSAGRYALPIVVVAILLDVVIRGDGWRYEWLWTFVQYNFVTIFLGPLAAGAGVVEGARWGPANALPWQRDRPLRAIATVWLSLVVWVCGPFVVGAGVVAAFVHLSGTPGGPTALDVAVLLPAVALLAGWLAIGLGIGWAAPTSLVVAPLTVAGAFAFSILAYGAMPGHLVDVGGATASLIGLQPRVKVMALQCAFWGLAGLGVLLLLAGGRSRRRLDLAGAALVVGLALAAYGGQVAAGGDRLEATDAKLLCTSGVPTICMGPGYQRTLPTVRRAIAPALQVLRAHGIAPPTELTQDQSRLTFGVGYLDRPVLKGDTVSGGYAVLNAYLPRGGVPTDDPVTSTAFNRLADLLAERLPAVAFPGQRSLRDGSDADVAATIDLLRRCGRP